MMSITPSTVGGVSVWDIPIEKFLKIEYIRPDDCLHNWTVRNGSMI